MTETPVSSLPRHVQDAIGTRDFYSRPPARHVLAIIDFSDLAELSSRDDQLSSPTTMEH